MKIKCLLTGHTWEHVSPSEKQIQWRRDKGLLRDSYYNEFHKERMVPQDRFCQVCEAVELRFDAFSDMEAKRREEICGLEKVRRETKREQSDRLTKLVQDLREGRVREEGLLSVEEDSDKELAEKIEPWGSY